MSRRIKQRFAVLREAGQSGLVTFTMMGDPDIETSFDILRGLPAAGAVHPDCPWGWQRLWRCWRPTGPWTR